MSNVWERVQGKAHTESKLSLRDNRGKEKGKKNAGQKGKANRARGGKAEALPLSWGISPIMLESRAHTKAAKCAGSA